MTKCHMTHPDCKLTVCIKLIEMYLTTLTDCVLPFNILGKQTMLNCSLFSYQQTEHLSQRSLYMLSIPDIKSLASEVCSTIQFN